MCLELFCRIAFTGTLINYCGLKPGFSAKPTIDWRNYRNLTAICCWHCPLLICIKVSLSQLFYALGSSQCFLLSAVNPTSLCTNMLLNTHSFTQLIENTCSARSVPVDTHTVSHSVSYTPILSNNKQKDKNMIILFLFFVVAGIEEFSDANAGGWRAVGAGSMHHHHYP